jgi:hypothetical protein
MSGGVVYDCATPRDLAHKHGLADDDSPAAFGEADAAWIAEFGASWGWDTPLYRADWLEEPGEYGPAPIDPTEAAKAFLGHDLSFFLVVTSPAECREAIGKLRGENAPRFGIGGPARAAVELERAAAAIGWGVQEAKAVETTAEIIARLNRDGMVPTMSADEVLKLTRGYDE